MNTKDLVNSVVSASLLKEYRWGGNGPRFDCSGLVIELLKTAGIFIPHDMSAQQLFEYFMPQSNWDERRWGALAFFGMSTNSISHVGFMLNNTHMVEAGGGTSLTKTDVDAQEQSAFIRIRPLISRKNIAAVLGIKYAFPV